MKSAFKYSTLLLASALVLGISTSFVKASADTATNSIVTTETTIPTTASTATLPAIHPTTRMWVDSDGDEVTQDWQEIMNGAWAGANVESGGHYFD
ncbi:hypothetical protein C5Z25_11255 [Lactobacillus sp. CBA3605]|uniref:hypothetical protein n=1 Tax=Lactobacillus sp. CBA3605 TaxID=2099788 RepID=UPI000CFC667E|nr:hypothetical protein [Lactobacillus sp. CBA3605]AVK62299.1 hypothetical protein C5Z25_11255 [Lactobacillus sp. CBA3605]